MTVEVSLASTVRIRKGATWADEISLPGMRIIAVSGADQHREWRLSVASIHLGSGLENDIVLNDSTVSRRHASLLVTDDGLLLRDLGSTNGTFVGSVRTREAFVESGSEIRLGQTRLKVLAATEKYYAVPGDNDRFGALIGGSPRMKEIYGMLDAVAATPATVLIEGESGTGKELVAKTLHELCGRQGPLITFDCAGTQPQLVQSELFGHLKGAYTGAGGAREGAFRAAHRGTLFLDELGELPQDIQPILLRCLETREIKPVGADRTQPVDVRLVAATNRDLEELVAQRQFRSDLFHRLSVIRLCLPPLRDRRVDIPILVHYFIETMALDVQPSKSAIEDLVQHSWPGNLRELRNVVERLGRLFPGQRITGSHVEKVLARKPSPGVPKLDVVERETILKALQQYGGNRRNAATALGISLSTLKRKLKEYRESPEPG